MCCRELFNQWLQQLPGTGSLSRTWGVLLNVVREALGPEVAKQIKTRLDSKCGGKGKAVVLLYMCACYGIIARSVHLG